ncbi:MAG: protein kinase, partial [Planctomycetales bacterium]|nr:protein kinase [Planctomycetales bacterium]
MTNSSNVNLNQANSTDMSRLADVVNELADRLSAGVPVDLADYLREYPEYAQSLRDIYSTLCHIDLAADCLTTPPAAKELGDFQLLREIGRGGMGIVYEARQLSLNRPVAVKVLPFAAMLDERRLQRFKHEAQSAAALRHPHIVGVHFVGCERGVHHFAMELVDGPSLSAIIAQLQADQHRESPDDDPGRTPASGREEYVDTRPIDAVATLQSGNRAEYFRGLARLALQAADALGHAHDVGIVHRDIKPSNLLVDRSGKLWVTDFGLAMSQCDSSLTLSGDVVGTLRYMSPEQANGRREFVDHRTDIYSLGATLYELVTLKPVFSESSRQAILRQIDEQEPVPLRHIDPTVPIDLETIVLKCLSKDIPSRYATAGELSIDLQRYLDDRPILARRVSAWQRMRRWIRRNRMISLLTATVIALLAVLTTLGFLSAARQSRLVSQANALQAQAQDLAEQTRHDLYVSVVNRSYDAWYAGDGPGTVAMLSSLIPQDQTSDLRGVEWHYLWNLTSATRLARRFHQEYMSDDYIDVSCIDVSPDGIRLAWAPGSNVVKCLEFATGKELYEIEADTTWVRCVRFSPDGRLLATVGASHVLKIWNASNGMLRQTIPLARSPIHQSPGCRWLA